MLSLCTIDLVSGRKRTKAASTATTHFWRRQIGCVDYSRTESESECSTPRFTSTQNHTSRAAPNGSSMNRRWELLVGRHVTVTGFLLPPGPTLSFRSCVPRPSLPAFLRPRFIVDPVPRLFPLHLARHARLSALVADGGGTTQE